MKSILRLSVLLGFILVIPTICSFSQVGINTDGLAPDPSAGLDVKFNNKGFLPPRMTYDQRNLIMSPAEGLMVYCTNCNSDGTGLLSMYQGGKWKNILLDCTTPASPTAGTHVPDYTQITWNWNTVPIAFGYKWNTVDNYSSATDLGTSTTKSETGLTICTNYTRYVWAYNTCGHSGAGVLTQATLAGNPPAPTAGEHERTCSLIIFHWNAVPGATGYKVNQSDDYNNAFNVGNSTSTPAPNCTPNTLYIGYVWAYNDCGHSTPTVLSCTTLSGLCIGLDYGGGTIFSIDGAGEHGLISAKTDQAEASWGCKGTLIGTSTDIGTGQANTTAIVNGCSDGSFAAKICDVLIMGSYTDWFLPSKDELYLMYPLKMIIGAFAPSDYWSSSESSADNAWLQNFGNGTQSAASKGSGITKVRAIRAF
jgi:hypothetical protein